MEFALILAIAIICLVILLLITAAVLLVYSGLFHNVVIRTGDYPLTSIHVAYKYAKGRYQDCGSLFDETSSVILKCQDSNIYSFGCYYDDPKQVGENACRYCIGAVLSEQHSNAPEEIKKAFESNGFSFTTFPAATRAVQTWFPFRTTYSIYLAVWRVYTRLTSYLVDHSLKGGPCLELYKGDRIIFVVPLDHHEGFYVPESGGHHDIFGEGNESSPAEHSTGDEEDPKVSPAVGDTKENGSESSSSFENIGAVEAGD